MSWAEGLRAQKSQMTTRAHTPWPPEGEIRQSADAMTSADIPDCITMTGGIKVVSCDSGAGEAQIVTRDKRWTCGLHGICRGQRSGRKARVRIRSKPASGKHHIIGRPGSSDGAGRCHTSARSRLPRGEHTPTIHVHQEELFYPA